MQSWCINSASGETLAVDDANSDSGELWAETTDEDVSCRRCGYNLRGLRLGGVCPECGLPLSLAMGGSGLADCDPDWLANLRMGVTWIFCAVIFEIVFNVLSRIYARSSQSGIPEEVIDVISKGINAYGAYLLTVPEFGVNAPPQPLVSVRALVRYGAWASLLGALLFAAPTEAQDATAILGMSLGIVGLVAYFGQFVFLRRLAMRIPDPPLAHSTTVVMWGIGISVTVGFTSAVAEVFSSQVGGAGAMIAGVCAALLAFIIFGIWYLVLLDQYRRAFKFAEQESINRSSLAMESADSPSVPPPDRFT